MQPLLDNLGGGSPQDFSYDGNTLYMFWNDDSQAAFVRDTPSGSYDSTSNTSTLPNGSECSLFGAGAGSLVDAVFCPLGLADEPSSFSSADESSSSSSSDDELSSSSGSDENVSSGSGGSGSSGSSGSGDSDGDGDCSSLNNCDWAKLDVQLQELGVAIEIRNIIYGIPNKLDQLSQNEIDAIRGVRDAVGSLHASNSAGLADVSGKLDGILGALGDGTGTGGGIGGILGGIGSALDGVGGIVSNIASSLSDIKDGLFGDGDGTCTGNDCGFGGTGVDTSGFGSKANSLIQGGGRGMSVYTDEQLGSLIPIPRSGQCPVIQGNINLGGTVTPVEFDFNNLIPGSPINVISFIRVFLLATVYFINVMTMLAIFRSGGRQ